MVTKDHPMHPSKTREITFRGAIHENKDPRKTKKPMYPTMKNLIKTKTPHQLDNKVPSHHIKCFPNINLQYFHIDYEYPKNRIT